MSQTIVGIEYNIPMNSGDCLSLTTFGGYVNSMDTPKEDLTATARKVIENVSEIGYEDLLEQQAIEWGKIWRQSDIEIKGDVSAQQAIRFNIFHLNLIIL